MKIVHKLWLSLLVFSLALFSFLAWLVSFEMKEILADNAISSLETVAAVTESRLKEEFDEHLEHMDEIVSSNFLKAMVNEYIASGMTVEGREKLSRDLAKLSREHIHSQDLQLVFNHDQSVVISEEAHSTAMDAEGVEKILDYMMSQRLQIVPWDKNNFLLVAPFHVDNVPLGYVIIQVDKEDFSRIVMDASWLGDTGEILLAWRNEQGQAEFVVPPRFNKNGSVIEVSAEHQAKVPMLRVIKTKKEEIFLTARDYRGQEVVAVSRYLPWQDWGLVVKMNKQEVYAPMKNIYQQMVVVTWIGFLMIFVCTALIARLVSGPVSALQAGVEIVSSGNWAHRIGLKGSDELTQVGKSFDQMIEKLQETTVSRDELEAQVRKQKQSELHLKETMDEMKRFNSLSVGREDRIIELKEEINCLHKDLGKPPPYDLWFAPQKTKEHKKDL